MDLRYNPGGLLELAGFVSNLFVPRGDIVTGEGRDGQMTFRFGAKSIDCYLGGVPTVVIVNRGSASASEIVAGCLQAHEAAVILGERSFGKGSVQTVHEVADSAKLKCTTQYYRLPAGLTGVEDRLVDKHFSDVSWGVMPDLEITMNPDQIEQWMAPFRTDFASAADDLTRRNFGRHADPEMVTRVAAKLAASDPEIIVQVVASKISNEPALLRALLR